MKKTAMQEWVEWLKAYEYELPLELQIKSKELLVLEKQQIIDAVTYGQNNYSPSTNADKEIAENYYYNTFK